MASSNDAKDPDTSQPETKPEVQAAVAPEAASQPQEPVSNTPPSKPIHSLVLDTGPLIKNDPPISTLVSCAEELYTIPSVLSEIRDEATRSRVNTTLVPFLKLRSPRPESVVFCTQFARKTGDLEVLSKTDLHLIALAYDLEIERNHGDWRLRREPAQQRLNGKPPEKDDRTKDQREQDHVSATTEETEGAVGSSESVAPEIEKTTDGAHEQVCAEPTLEDNTAVLENLDLAEAPITETQSFHTTQADEQPPEETSPEDSSDSDGWITPSNLHKHKAKDAGQQVALPNASKQQVLQVALLTSDYAMQNVLVRMNLNLVSPSLARITRLKTWVLRCHGCFALSHDTARQFCASCGKPTLTRVACSTSAADGSFTLHLKHNFQFNKRGNVYSVPKPVHGSASGKAGAVKGGGKGGWGQGLILSEDQKEYTKALDRERRSGEVRDLLDPDYLPGILGGARKTGAESGRIRVGAGRNVNGRRRR